MKLGDDPTDAAWPPRRVIQRQVENPAAKQVLSDELAEGDTVQVDHGAGGFTFTKVEAVTAAA